MGMFDKLKKGMLGGQMVDFITGQKGAESGRKLGYELICRGNNTRMMKAGKIWLKGGSYYYTPTSILGGGVLDGDFSETESTPIEITGVSEITKNAKLVALEVRYRINGVINSMQVTELVDILLTIEDKLLNGGYISEPEFEETESGSEGSSAFCGQCGAQSKGGTKFCTECGAPLR
jgi:hypothetical protein